MMCSLLKTVKYFTMLTLLTRTEDKVHLRLIYPSSYQEGDVNVYVLIIHEIVVENTKIVKKKS